MALLDAANLVLRTTQYDGSDLFRDESGRNNHAELSGTYSSDGTKLTLDDTGNGRMEILSPTSLDLPGTEYTAAVLARIPSTPSGEWSRLVADGDTGSAYNWRLLTSASQSRIYHQNQNGGPSRVGLDYSPGDPHYMVGRGWLSPTWHLQIMIDGGFLNSANGINVAGESHGGWVINGTVVGQPANTTMTVEFYGIAVFPWALDATELAIVRNELLDPRPLWDIKLPYVSNEARNKVPGAGTLTPLITG